MLLKLFHSFSFEKYIVYNISREVFFEIVGGNVKQNRASFVLSKFLPNVVHQLPELITSINKVQIFKKIYIQLFYCAEITVNGVKAVKTITKNWYLLSAKEKKLQNKGKDVKRKMKRKGRK